MSRAPRSPLSIEELDLGPPRADEVRVRVVAVGVCHTDLQAIRGAPDRLPIVLGHEGVGVVEEVGETVARVRPGDHVVMSYDSCGRCRSCAAGRSASCAELFARNFSGRRADGSTALIDATGEPVGSRWFAQSSFASFALATERNVVRVDPELPLEVLAPLGCGVQTGAASVLIGLGATSGSTMAVFGVGCVGLSAVMAGRLAGCAEIIAVDVVADRLDLARSLGATRTFSGDDPDLVSAIRACSGGGVDATLDTTALPAVISAAVATLAIGGTAGLVGLRDVLHLPPDVFTGGRTLTYLIEGGAVPQQFIPYLITQWQAGRFPFEELIRYYDFAAIDDALGDVERGETIKAVLRLPGG